MFLCSFVFPVEVGVPPPVPPRRRKRKSDVIPIKPTTAPRNKKGCQPIGKVVGSRPDRKPRSLPPPPPVPRSAARESKPESTKSINSQPIDTDYLKTKDAKLKSCDVNLSSKPLSETFTGMTKKQRFVVTKIEANEEPPKISISGESNNLVTDQNLEYRNENLSGRSSPMPSKNSPLLFTLQDFESVMSNSAMSDRSVNEQYESIITPDTSRHTSISSVVENSMTDKEEEENHAFFRVTTTNVPFEKCVGSFSFSIDNKDFEEKFDDPDHYIFEDYMDRSKRWNARPPCLFDDDTFDHFGKDDGAGSTRRTATKVRFVIESPSSSTPDPDLDNTCDSLGNIESIIVDDGIINENQRTSVIITEIMESNQPIEEIGNTDECSTSDQFGDVPFSSILDNEIHCIRDMNSGEMFNDNFVTSSKQVLAIANNNEEVGNDESRETESMQPEKFENRKTVRSPHSPRFSSPKKIIDVIPNIDESLMPELPITYDPRDEGFVKTYWDLNSDDFNDEVSRENQSDPAEPTWKISSEGSRAAREAFVNGKLKAESSENENQNCAIAESLRIKDSMDKPELKEKKKIFIDSALCDFIDNDDIEWYDSSDDEGNSEKLQNTAVKHNNDFKFEESDVVGLLNRDTYLGKEVLIDKHPRTLMTNDNESNNEKLANKEVSKIEPELAEFSRTQHLINSLTLSRESKDDENWVSVSVRRNSFLENMLTEDKTKVRVERNVPCSIIAAHPKPTCPQAAARSSSTVSNIPRERVVGAGVFRNVDKSSHAGTIEILPSGSNELSQKQLRYYGSGEKMVGAAPDSHERIASSCEIEKKKQKSTGEAKSDVLSELLCNFSAIKLKSVEPYKREIDWSVVDDKPVIVKEIEDKWEMKEVENEAENVRELEMSGNERKVEGAVVKAVVSRPTKTSTLSTTTTKGLDIEDSSLKDSVNRAAGEKTHYPNNLRTIDYKSPIIIHKCTEIEELRENVKADDTVILDTGLMRMTVDQQMISVDKCAIDRKSNSLIRCNNNDNNAMTPVDISNDQKSCEADVNIAPGSVRSFVELYEIQRDQTSKYSKSNYSLPVAKRSTRCCKGFTSYNNEIDAEEEVLLGDKNVEIVKTTDEHANAENEMIIQESRQINAQRSSVDLSNADKNQDLRYSVITRHIVREYSNESLTNDGLSSTNGLTYVQHRQQQFSSSVPVAAKRRSLEPSLDTTTKLSTENESKKSPKYNCYSETMKLNCDEDTRLKTNRRAPEKPTNTRVTEERDCATKSIAHCDWMTKPTPSRFIWDGDTMNPTPTPRSDVSLIRTQIQRGVEDKTNDTVHSGIAPLAPKSDVSHPRQPYAFLCRV